MPTQTAVQAGAGNVRIEEYAYDDKQIVQAQTAKLSQFYRHDFLRRAEGSLQAVGGMGLVQHAVALLPLADGVDADIEACDPLGKRAHGVFDFLADGGGGAGLFVQSDDHGLGARESCSRIPMTSRAVFSLNSRLLL